VENSSNIRRKRRGREYLLTAIELRNAESTPVTHQPLLSVIVPVYNGGNKIERTLENLQEKISQIESVMWDVEYQRSKIEGSVLQAEEDPVTTNFANVDNKEKITMFASGNLSSNVQVASTDVSANQKETHSLQPPYSALSLWYELIVVNDGSTDDTRSQVEKISKSDERLRLISYSTNMGKGYAIKQGVLHSKGKYILFMDGDGDIGADVLANYLTRMSKADIVIGSKHHSSSIVHAPASRRFLSRCFQLFVRGMLGLKARDTQVGLKAGRGDLFRKIFDKVLVKRYAFDAEMLVIADLLKSKVVELPVKIDLDRSFKKKEIVKMALDVIGIAFRLRVMRWYQKNMEKQRPSYKSSAFFL